MKQTTQTYLSLPETFHPASTTSGKQPDSSMPRCYSDGRPYYSLNAWLKDQFGQKIYKLALDGGMTCPNRDGTLGTGGCIFCSHGGSGDFAEPAHTSVTEQIEAAKARVANKIKGGKYVAYFQSYTNTYAPISYLEPLFFRSNRPPGRGCPVHRNPPGLPAAGCPGASRPLKPPKTGLGGTGTSDHP